MNESKARDQHYLVVFFKYFFKKAFYKIGPSINIYNDIL